jgi:hypothetical protein
MASFITYNNAMVTTAAFAPITTGTAIKTMLQIKAPTGGPMTVFKYGVSFDGSGTTPIKVELLDTGTIAATVTAHVAAGIIDMTGRTLTSAVQLGTSASGYTATAEGTITTTRSADTQQILPGNYFQNEWSSGREFIVPAGNIVRIRVTATAAVNCQCFMAWDE